MTSPRSSGSAWSCPRLNEVEKLGETIGQSLNDAFLRPKEDVGGLGSQVSADTERASEELEFWQTTPQGVLSSLKVLISSHT
eukprot:676486-Amphidinium_carterae.1